MPARQDPRDEEQRGLLRLDEARLTFRLSSAAAERNKGPLLDVLQRILPARGLILEVASGGGQHIVHFAKALPALTWQPNDPDPDARASIAEWTAADKLGNVRAPTGFDARDKTWPVSACDAIVCINMIHIAPWAAAEGLFAGAQRVLPAAAVLYLYGPYRVHGRTAPSNAAFDEDLRARDPEWGVRELDDVAALAARHGFGLAETVAMPANNLSVVFRAVR